MDAQVHGWILFGPIAEFLNPGAGHHDTGRGDEAFLHGFAGGDIGGVAHAGVIGVNDEALGGGWL